VLSIASTARLFALAALVLTLSAAAVPSAALVHAVVASAQASTLDPQSATADQFFGLIKIYRFELTISAADFQSMQPPSGRGGRGVGGFDGPGEQTGSGYPKVNATLRFEGRDWGEITVRYKGNSSFRGARSTLKRSLKLEFSASDKDHRFFGMPTLNLNNNAFDSSQMRESLAYDVFRRAGVPAPRTAYAELYVTVPGQYQHEYAGLFTIVEQVNQQFFRERWDHKVGVLVKPEGLHGMPDLGDDWRSYVEPYASKVTAKPQDTARLIAFIQFVAHADDAEFARRIGDYLDIDEFLHFLATEVVLVNTDSPLAMNHNYWLTVHPRTHRVVWVPWDMNMAFGGFRNGDSELSVHQPSSPGRFPLADRVLANPSLRARYDAIVRQLITSAASPERLETQMQRIASAVRGAVARDPSTTLRAFERNLEPLAPPEANAPTASGQPEFFWGGHGAPALRGFLETRNASIAQQLDGKRSGTPGRPGFGGVGGAD
jgi:spore coat protein H